MNARIRRALAVVFSVLLVTATLTPATAGLEPPDRTDSDGLLADLALDVPFVDDPLSGTASASGSDDGTSEPSGATTTPGNDAATTTTTATTTAGGPPDESDTDESDSQLDGTDGVPDGTTEEDDTTLEPSESIPDPVTELPGSDPDISEWQLNNMRDLATEALSDAKRVENVLSERGVQFEDPAVEEDITAATDKVQLAEQYGAQDQRYAAYTRYKDVLNRSQQALDRMDLDTKPNVTITSHADAPHDGNATYRVTGRVFDVRTQELDPLTLVVNGEERTVSFDANGTPGSVDTFRTTLTLTEQANDIEVVATDPNDPKAPNAGPGNADPTNGTDRLRLDGDGLPDWYESNVTGTDPLDVDSDDDGLRDGFEFQHPGLDPLANDTDGDGVVDAEGDLDDDSVSNAREQAEGTNPARADSDGDGLTDAEELANGTNPVARDTDGDGVPDAEEYDLGTDPTEADSDGDGVLDGDETFSATADNESLGASVTVSSEGTVADAVSVTNESTERTRTGAVANASASEALSFEADAAFERANLSIEYDEARASDDDVAVYTYNESQQTYVELPSDVDAANDTVTATTPNASAVVAMNETEWQEYLRSPARPDPNYVLRESFGNLSGWNCTGDCEATGGSAVVGVGAPDAAGTEDVLGSGDVSRDDAVEVSAGGGGSTDPCYSPSSSLSPDAEPCPGDGDDDTTTEEPPDDGGGGGSDPCYSPSSSSVSPSDAEPCPGYGDGTTTEEPPDDGDGTTTTTVSPPTDGDSPRQFDPMELERSVSIPADAVQVNVTTVASVFAEESNASVELVASIGGDARTILAVDGKDGQRVSDGDSVTKTFETPSSDQVAFWVQSENVSGARVDSVNITLKRDSDGDGLTNELERDGIKTGDGDRVYTDPYDADTDGDGLSDGEEVAGHIPEYEDGGFFELKSNPTEVDSDEDGLDDYEERRIWETDVWDEDSDGDGYTDLVDERPNVEDVVPDIRVHQAGQDYVEVAVKDDESSVRNVVVNGSYTPKLGDQFWKESTPSDCNHNPETYDFCRIHIYQHGTFSESPDSYYLNVTDANGNTVVFHFEDTGESGSFAVSAAAVASGTQPVRLGSNVFESLAAGSRIAAGLSLTAITAYYYEHQSKNFEGGEFAGTTSTGTVPGTSIAVAATYEPEHRLYHEHDVELPIKLPSGTVYQEEVGDGVHRRGYGEEYIDAVFPGVLSGDEIGEVLRHPNAIRQDGPYTLVIGETGDGDEIVLRLLDGLIISTGGIIEEPQWIDEPVKIPNDKSHFQDREQEHITDDSEIRRIVEQANEVYTNNHGLYVWVLYEHGEIKVVHAFDRSLEDGTDEEMFTVSTAYYVENGAEAWERIKEGLQLIQVYPDEE